MRSPRRLNVGHDKFDLESIPSCGMVVHGMRWVYFFFSVYVLVSEKSA